MAIRYVTLNGQKHEISTESLRGLGEWGWDISQEVINTSGFNVKSYGAVGDGTTDDTEAIQAAIDACGLVSSNAYSSGGAVVFPPGVYKVTDTLVVYAHWGVRLVGASKTATCLQASGSGWSGKALIKMQRSEHCSIENMCLSTDGTAAPNSAVFLSSDTASPGHAGPVLNISSRNALRNVQIWNRDTASTFTYGVRIGGTSNANNDFHLFDNVEIIGCATAGVISENTQAVDHTFVQCFVLDCTTGVDVGSFVWIGGALGSNSSSDIGLGVGQGAGMGVRVFGGNSEGSKRLLTTNVAPGVSHNVCIRGFRFSGDAMTDTNAVIFERAGPLVIEDCLFDASSGSFLPKIYYSSVRTITGAIRNNFWNCQAIPLADPITWAPYAASAGYPGGVSDIRIEGNLFSDAQEYKWPDPVAARTAPTFSDSTPTIGTWFVGQRVDKITTTSGGVMGQVCTKSGRFGTYSEGRTATTNGTTTVTLNSASSILLVGDFVTINATEVRITAISGTTVTVSANIPAAGPGLAIAYTVPVFKDYGVIA